MESNFQRSLSLVLKSEGGWADHPRDPGGATMKGVTLATYRRYKPGASKDDLRNISDSMLARIYRDGYWDTISGDDLPAGVDYAVFDFGVNSGPSRAAKYLQRIAGVRADGKIGPITIKALKALPVQFIIEELCDDRMDFLRGLSTWSDFGRGWANRVTDVRKRALAMASEPLDVDHSPSPDPEPVAGGKNAALMAGAAALIAAIAAWAGDVWHWLVG